MSLILDALRRENASIGTDRVTGRRAANAQAVLATLGYQPVRRRRSEAVGRWGLAVVAVVLVGGGAWSAYRWYDTRSGAQPQGTSAPQTARQAAPDARRPTLPAAVAPTSSGSVVRPSAARETQEATSVATPQAMSQTATSQNAPVPAVRQPAASPVPPKAVEGPALDRQPVVVKTRPQQSAVKTARASAPSGGEPVPPVPGPSGAVITSTYEPDNFKLALYYHRAGDFENALINYRALLERNELNAEVRNNLGLLYQEKNLLDESVRELQRAISIDPMYAKAHNNLGVTLLHQGKLDAAMAEFRVALSIDPKNAEPMVNMALALKTAGRPDEARDTLRRALELDQMSGPAHYNLALLYEEAGDAAKAIEHFQTFLKVNKPEHAYLSAGVRARIDALTARVKQ